MGAGLLTKTENEEKDDHNIESNTTFNLVEEHPSHRYMVMAKRKKYVIHKISCSNLLPNIEDLELLNTNNNDINVSEKRQKYAKIALLVFYPYRIQSDLEKDGSRWELYIEVLDRKKYLLNVYKYFKMFKMLAITAANLNQQKMSLQQ